MSLLQVVRSRSTDAAYTRGVQLARRGLVQGVGREDNAVMLRVAEPNLRNPWTVHLWPDSGEWSCDCPIPADACAHVVAAVISIEHTEKRAGPEAMPQMGELPDGVPVHAGPPSRIPAPAGYPLSR